jgi:hypothetical protein
MTIQGPILSIVNWRCTAFGGLGTLCQEPAHYDISRSKSLLAYALEIHILWVEASPTSYLLLGCIIILPVQKRGTDTVTKGGVYLAESNFLSHFLSRLTLRTSLNFSKKVNNPGGQSSTFQRARIYRQSHFASSRVSSMGK